MKKSKMLLASLFLILMLVSVNGFSAPEDEHRVDIKTYAVNGDITEQFVTRLEDETLNIIAKPKVGLRSVILIDGITVSQGQVNQVSRYRLNVAENHSVDIYYSAATDEVVGILTGQFLDSAVHGVRYITSSGVGGFTGGNGEYQYNAGDTVEFFIGDVSLGRTQAIGFLTTSNLPFSNQVAQFLQTLDEDAVSDNGIQIVRSLHDSPLLKRSAIMPERTIFSESLKVENFSDNNESIEFINAVVLDAGMEGRGVTSDNKAFEHRIKVEKLERIKKYNNEFYSYIDGSFYNPDLPNLPLTSNVSDVLNSRLAYYFYNKIYQNELQNKSALYWNTVRGVQETSNEIKDFARSYFNIGGLITEISIYMTDSITGINDSDLSHKTKRRIVNSVLTSGKSGAVDYFFNDTAKELLQVTENCVGSLPWPASVNGIIDEFIKKAAENAGIFINCAVGQSVETTANFILAYKGSNALEEYEAHIIAEEYLDVYFSCGGSNSSCIASELGNNETFYSQLQSIMDRMQFSSDSFINFNADWVKKNKAKIVIDQYITTVSTLSKGIVDSLPSDSFFNFAKGNRNTSNFHASIEPLELSDADEGVLWVSLDLNNISGRDIYVTGFSPEFIVSSESFKIGSDYYMAWSDKLYEPKFLANKKVNGIHLPISLNNNFLPRDGMARLVISIDYKSSDGVISDSIQRVIDLDLALLWESNEIEKLDTELVTISTFIDTAQEGDKYYLPKVYLNGGQILEQDNIEWDMKSQVYEHYSISGGVDSIGQYLYIPQLRVGYDSDIIVLNAYVNDSPYSEPAIFTLNIIKKEVLPSVVSYIKESNVAEDNCNGYFDTGCEAIVEKGRAYTKNWTFNAVSNVDFSNISVFSEKEPYGVVVNDIARTKDQASSITYSTTITIPTTLAPGVYKARYKLINSDNTDLLYPNDSPAYFWYKFKIKEDAVIATPIFTSGVAISDITGGFRLGWNSASGVITQYELYRSTSAGVLGSQAYSGTATSYNDTNVTSGIRYYYTVKACNNEGCTSGEQDYKDYIDASLSEDNAPSVSYNTASNQTYTDSFSLSISATDDIGLSLLAGGVYTTGGSYAGVTIGGSVSGTSVTKSYTVNTSSLPDGNYKIKLVAQDTTSQASSDVWFYFSKGSEAVDNAPSVSYNTASNQTYTDSFSLSISATDDIGLSLLAGGVYTTGGSYAGVTIGGSVSGTSVTKSYTVNTSSLPDGNYKIKLLAQDTTSQASSDVWFNFSKSTAQQLTPDLSISNFSLNKTTFTVGETLSISAIVKNIGTASSASSTLRYYVSADSSITSSDSPLGTDAVAALSANGTSNESFSWNIPASGSLYVGACVDSVSNEASTSNNCATGVKITINEVTNPDLSISNFSLNKTTFTVGETLSISAIVKNIGTASSASSTLRYYVSADSSITSSDSPLGTDAVAALSANGTSNESFSWNIPASGSLYVGACVDSVSNEASTSNNCATGVKITIN